MAAIVCWHHPCTANSLYSSFESRRPRTWKEDRESHPHSKKIIYSTENLIEQLCNILSRASVLILTDKHWSVGLKSLQLECPFWPPSSRRRISSPWCSLSLFLCCLGLNPRMPQQWSETLETSLGFVCKNKSNGLHQRLLGWSQPRQSQLAPRRGGSQCYAHHFILWREREKKRVIILHLSPEEEVDTISFPVSRCSRFFQKIYTLLFQTFVHHFNTYLLLASLLMTMATIISLLLS